MKVLSSIFSSEPLVQLLGSRPRVDAVVVALLLALAGAEIALRAATREPGPLSRSLSIVSEGYSPPPHVFDADLGYRYTGHASSLLVRPGLENLVRTNGDGYRDTEFTRDKAPDVYRIAILGDSYLAGNQVPISDLWPSVIERELPAVANRRLEVFNFGIDGYHIWNQVRLIDEVLDRYDPDLVLLAGMIAKPAVPQYRRAYSTRTVLIADTIEGLDDAAEQARQAGAEVAPMLPDWIMQQFLIARAAVRLSDRVPLSRMPGFIKVRKLARRDFEATLATALSTIRAACTARGTAFAISWRDPAPAEVAGLVSELGPLSVQESDFLPPDYAGMIWPRDAHFTPAGHRLYARRFAPYLLDMVRAASRVD